jgi:hypothetical protein
LKEQMLPAKDEISCPERRLNETFWVLDVEDGVAKRSQMKWRGDMV